MGATRLWLHIDMCHENKTKLFLSDKKKKKEIKAFWWFLFVDMLDVAARMTWGHRFIVEVCGSIVLINNLMMIYPSIYKTISTHQVTALMLYLYFNKNKNKKNRNLYNLESVSSFPLESSKNGFNLLRFIRHWMKRM